MCDDPHQVHDFFTNVSSGMVSLCTVIHLFNHVHKWIESVTCDACFSQMDGEVWQ